MKSFRRAVACLLLLRQRSLFQPRQIPQHFRWPLAPIPSSFFVSPPSRYGCLPFLSDPCEPEVLPGQRASWEENWCHCPAFSKLRRNNSPNWGRGWLYFVIKSLFLRLWTRTQRQAFQLTALAPHCFSLTGPALLTAAQSTAPHSTHPQ